MVEVELSMEWREEQTRVDATLIAHERLKRFEREHDERFAQYELTWERRFARQRAAAATGVPSLWRVVK